MMNLRQSPISFLQSRINPFGGWERAIDAQTRIVATVAQHLHSVPDQSVLFVGHGAVGTLLKCHLAQRPIARVEDQQQLGAPGGGNIFAFDWIHQRLITDWVTLEDSSLLHPLHGLPDQVR